MYKEYGFFRKMRKVFEPLLLYYGVYIAALFLLSWLLQMLAGAPGGGGEESGVRAAAGIGKLLEEHRESVTGIVNGIGMLIGTVFLLPMLRMELQMRIQPCQKDERAVSAAIRGRLRGWQGTIILLLTVMSAVSSSVGLNILLSLTGLVQTSAAYQGVAQRQYGAAFGVGLLLYTVVSPLAEEIVFRGVIYNRLRHCLCGMGNAARDRGVFGVAGRIPQKDDMGFRQRRGSMRHGALERGVTGQGQVAAIVVSGVLFGVYHGNLVQGIYGCCMGILMAYLYEETQAFCIPVLFHASANCVVYLMARNTLLQERMLTVPWCAALTAVTIVEAMIIRRLHYDE